VSGQTIKTCMIKQKSHKQRTMGHKLPSVPTHGQDFNMVECETSQVVIERFKFNEEGPV